MLHTLYNNLILENNLRLNSKKKKKNTFKLL